MRVLLEAFLVDCGRPRIDEILAQMAQDGAKLKPRWRQGAPSWDQDCHFEAIWAAILNILGGLGSDLLKNVRSVKTDNTTTFWPHFGVLGGLDGGSWGVFWAILAISWALLGDLGHNLGSLGRSWRQVRNLLATCWDLDGQRSPKIANVNRKK